MNNNNTESDTPAAQPNEPNHLTMKTDQLAVLTGQELRPQVSYGMPGYAYGETGWVAGADREDGTPAVTATLSFPNFAHPFTRHMVAVLRAEAQEGRHTQLTLDAAMDLCVALVPDEGGWVSARPLHDFLGEDRDFHHWCRWVALHADHSRVRGCCRTELPPRREGDRQAGGPFKVSPDLALRVALSSPTPRGDTLRRQFFDLPATLNSTVDFDEETYTGELPMTMAPNGASMRPGCRATPKAVGEVG